MLYKLEIITNSFFVGLVVRKVVPLIVVKEKDAMTISNSAEPFGYTKILFITCHQLKNLSIAFFLTGLSTHVFVANKYVCGGNTLSCDKTYKIMIQELRFYMSEGNCQNNSEILPRKEFNNNWDFTNLIYERCSLSNTCNLTNEYIYWSPKKTYIAVVKHACIKNGKDLNNQACIMCPFLVTSKLICLNLITFCLNIKPFCVKPNIHEQRYQFMLNWLLARYELLLWPRHFWFLWLFVFTGVHSNM